MSLDLDYATRLGPRAATSYGLQLDRGGAAPRRLLGLRRAAPQRARRHAGHRPASTRPTRWGFRLLLEMGCCDILQPDVGWCGGLTELVKISALADAHGKLVVPHGSSVYSYHFVITRHNSPFAEFLMMASGGGRGRADVHARSSLDEPVPVNGRLRLPETPGLRRRPQPRVRARLATDRPAAQAARRPPHQPAPAGSHPTTAAHEDFPMRRSASESRASSVPPSWTTTSAPSTSRAVTRDIDGDFLAGDGIARARAALAAGELQPVDIAGTGGSAPRWPVRAPCCASGRTTPLTPLNPATRHRPGP